MRGSAAPVAIVIDQRTDQLGKLVVESLRKRKQRTYWISSENLASCRLNVKSTGATCDGQLIGAVLFHCRPGANFGSNFEESDREFSSNEARAVWLSILQIPSVLAVNRLDAEIWYSSAEWAVWRRRLQLAGVPLSDISVGDSEPTPGWSWLPWGGGKYLNAPGPSVRRTFAPALTAGDGFYNSLWCCGQIISGPGGKHIETASEIMASYGMQLGSILTNKKGQVVSCTTSCLIPDFLAPVVTHRITEVINAHLCSR